MTHGSLFSGIGGFDLAAEWMGWENIFHCEWNLFGQKILKHYWPYAKSYTDITKTDFSIHRGEIDILTGGFPCQPYSVAGKRKGKEDDRHLWPEMLRAVREVQPRFVVGENVPGLINWSGGMVLKEIKADLEAEGFEILATNIIPACAKNAPHRRDRLWIVAHSVNGGHKAGREEEAEKDGVQGFGGETVDAGEFNGADISQTYSNSNNKRLQRCEINGGFGEIRKNGNEQFAGLLQPGWENFPTQPPIRFGNDGISGELDGITFPKWRVESIKAAGNAIVPQVAYEIFKAISHTNL